MNLEYQIPMNDRLGGIATIEIHDAVAVPRVGEYVMVDGYRKVLKIEHYYGVVVSNGVHNMEYMQRQDPSFKATGAYETVYVTVGRRLKRKERGLV